MAAWRRWVGQGSLCALVWWKHCGWPAMYPPGGKHRWLLRQDATCTRCTPLNRCPLEHLIHHAPTCALPISSSLQALGQKQIKLTDIPDWLSRHLLPMPPICFKYTVKLDGDSPSRPDCYDLDFQVGRRAGASS
jgi:hypothetical protein